MVLINGTELDSMKTPSYPSGHATQGYLLVCIMEQISSNIQKKLKK